MEPMKVAPRIGGAALLASEFPMQLCCFDCTHLIEADMLYMQHRVDQEAQHSHLPTVMTTNGWSMSVPVMAAYRLGGCTPALMADCRLPADHLPV